jgi:hypothetical protein
MPVAHSAAPRGSRPPLQNRVTPFGEIVAVSERGTMMGNRGILHDVTGRLRRRWTSPLWICCVLQFRGRRDPVMAPGHYTRLFFLDEPTALAAGHRPCAYCRRAAYNAFRSAWTAANADLGLGANPRAVEIDRVLHAQRLGPGGSKRLHRADLTSLPDGTFIAQPDSEHTGGSPHLLDSGKDCWIRPGTLEDGTAGLLALLIWHGERWQWTPGGYRSDGPVGAGPVLTLTPPSIIRALAGGYRPEPPALPADLPPE